MKWGELSAGFGRDPIFEVFSILGTALINLLRDFACNLDFQVGGTMRPDPGGYEDHEATDNCAPSAKHSVLIYCA